eukprot:scaffold209_cov396-Prasinococcus_capsulatus_cf.AAC.11
MGLIASGVGGGGHICTGPANRARGLPGIRMACPLGKFATQVASSERVQSEIHNRREEGDDGTQTTPPTKRSCLIILSAAALQLAFCGFRCTRPLNLRSTLFTFGADSLPSGPALGFGGSLFVDILHQKEDSEVRGAAPPVFAALEYRPERRQGPGKCKPMRGTSGLGHGLSLCGAGAERTTARPGARDPALSLRLGTAHCRVADKPTPLLAERAGGVALPR